MTSGLKSFVSALQALAGAISSAAKGQGIVGKVRAPDVVRRLAERYCGSVFDKKEGIMLKSIVDRIPQLDKHLARHMDLWSSGIASEIDFWDDWMTRYPQERAARLNKDNQLDPLIAHALRWAPYQPGQPYRVLDVGSGPLTCIGFTSAGTTQPEISACDPLAEAYVAICRSHRINVPVPVTFAMVEELSAVFAPDSFDVVNCGNALDHTFNPVQGIFEMMKVVKVGGTVLLRHTRNEGERENYSGLHQWNFDSTEEGFVIWSPDARFVINELVDEQIETSLHGDEPAQVWVKIKKSKPATGPRAGRELSDLAQAVVQDYLRQRRVKSRFWSGIRTGALRFVSPHRFS